MPPHFDSVSWLPPQQIRLVLSGSAGTSNRVYRSSNLVDWVLWTNVLNSSGTLSLTDAPAPGVARQFYRATSP